MSARGGAGPTEEPPTTEEERRAEAAKKTIAVLKKKVVALYNGDGSAMHQKLQAARDREADSRKRREILEARADELARGAAALEAEVARRTAAMKAILDNVPFGLLRVDRRGIVEPESTRSCRRLLDVAEVEGRSLAELLDLGPRARGDLEVAIEQVFDDVLPEVVSLAEIERRVTCADRRVLRVEASVVRRADGAVGSLLVTIADETALAQVTRENKENRALVAILREKPSFATFVSETRAALDDARARPDETTRRRVVHTIKGNAASYGLESVTDTCHAAEEGALDDAALDRVERAIRDILSAHRSVLEIDFDATAKSALEIGEGAADELRKIARTLRNPELDGWIERASARPAARFLGPIGPFAESLAERLGKQAALVVRGESVAVDPSTMGPVLQAVPHLVRNALDHGIEAPHLRRAKGPGRLELSIEEIERGYTIRFRDDGAGIDVEALVARAAERGIAPPASPIDLVFVDGLSTASETTAVSGRGIGLAALRAAAEGAGGTVEVTSKRGVGTEVLVFVPRPRPSRAPA